MASSESTFGFAPPVEPSSPRQRIVITGSAGDIGSATVAEFLRAGHSVTGLDLNSAPANIGDDPHYQHIRINVNDNARLVRVAESVRQANHLVVVAGGALPEEKGLDDILVPVDVFEASLAANLTSAYASLHAFLPALRAAEGDRSITFISSINAIGPYGLPAYSAAKAGMSGIKNALVVPLGAEGIRINCVLPGTVPTSRTVVQSAHIPGHFDKMAAGIPLGRLGTPRDIAITVFHLAINMTHVNGTDVIVDGGQHLRG